MVKLRNEAGKLPAEKAERCNTILDAIEKQTVNSVLFQPGDGRRKLNWQTCVFSLARSERIYFLDLVTRGELPDELNPDKKPEPETRRPEPQPEPSDNAAPANEPPAEEAKTIATAAET